MVVVEERCLVIYGGPPRRFKNDLSLSLSPSWSGVEWRPASIFSKKKIFIKMINMLSLLIVYDYDDHIQLMALEKATQGGVH